MKLSGDEVDEIEKLKYLESVIQKDMGVEEDMKHRIKCSWMKWRKTSVYIQ